jgi:DMSO/TMAO reductase YedYZ heme-binding membrane subunit
MERQGVVLAGGIATLFLLVSASTLLTGGDPISLLVRLLALNGYLALAITASMSPFLREIRAVFGRPFLAVHHTLAAFGLAAILLHPLSYALMAGNLAVLLPSTWTWGEFWTYAGRPALVLIFIALIAVSLRKRYPAHWRPFHMLMYAALALGLVHALLRGTDTTGPVVRAVLGGAFALVMGDFVLKRRQRQKT